MDPSVALTLNAGAAGETEGGYAHRGDRGLSEVTEVTEVTELVEVSLSK